MDTPYEEPPLPVRSGGTSSASLRTPAGSSQAMTQGATSMVCTPPHNSAGKDPATEDEEDDDDDDDQWEDWLQDEIGMSQLGGAPLGTQGATGTNKDSLFQYVGSMN